ncbi:hypothetical protein ABBQ38_005785 [Trebouxia sp. C0009 RCD-2024]
MTERKKSAQGRLHSWLGSNRAEPNLQQTATMCQSASHSALVATAQDGLDRQVTRKRLRTEQPLATDLQEHACAVTHQLSARQEVSNSPGQMQLALAAKKEHREEVQIPAGTVFAPSHTRLSQPCLPLPDPSNGQKPGQKLACTPGLVPKHSVSIDAPFVTWSEGSWGGASELQCMPCRQCTRFSRHTG